MKSCRVVLPVMLLALLAGTSVGQYIEATLTVGAGPTAMVYDSIDRKVFVANNGSNTVSVINATNNRVDATVTVGDKPVAMCWSPTSNKVYVACAPFSGTGSVHVINAATNQWLTSADVGSGPAAVAWSSTRNKVYCLDVGSSTVSVINCADDQLLTTISVGSANKTPVDIAYNPANDQVYFTTAALGSSGNVRAIDCGTDQVVATIPAGLNPGLLTANPRSNRVYACNKSGNTVSVIDGSSNQGLGQARVGQEPTPVLWTPQNKVFIGEYWSTSVAFMHGDSLRVQGRITVPGNPRTLIYVPGTQKVVCTNMLAGKVSLLDARNGHEDLVMNIQVGGGPLPMAVYPPDNRVFVGNSWENTVTVIKDIVGVEEGGQGPRLKSLFAVYPNPARLGEPVHFGQGVSLELRDASGRKVASVSGSWRPSVPGVYFVHSAAGQPTIKLVVE